MNNLVRKLLNEKGILLIIIFILEQTNKIPVKGYFYLNHD